MITIVLSYGIIIIIIVLSYGIIMIAIVLSYGIIMIIIPSYLQLWYQRPRRSIISLF